MRRLPFEPAPALSSAASIAAAAAPASAPTVAADGSCERFAGRLQLPSAAANVVPIFSTTRKWRSIELHARLTSDAMGGGGSVLDGGGPVIEVNTLVFRVWAVVAGHITQVARGRLGNDDLFASARVLAFCGEAERFQVDVAHYASAAQEIDVAVVASDLAVPVPPRLGAVWSGFVDGAASFAINAAPEMGVELECVGVQAVTKDAGRWVHLLDRGNGGVDTIVASWAVAPGSSSFLDMSEIARAWRFRTKLRLDASTTHDSIVHPAAGSVRMGVWWR